jgi:hypothetical protein
MSFQVRGVSKLVISDELTNRCVCIRHKISVGECYLHKIFGYDCFTTIQKHTVFSTDSRQCVLQTLPQIVLESRNKKLQLGMSVKIACW